MDAEPAQSNLGMPVRPPGGASVLQLAQSGDQQAFRQLVEQHQAKVFGVALRLMGRHADAQELAQDVFVQLRSASRWADAAQVLIT
jgi:DNA-directed RNA polymerase specialized sigma24 family protein